VSSREGLLLDPALLWMRKAVQLRDGEAALELAKWYLAGNRPGEAKNLLLKAMNWRSSMSEAGVEETVELIDELQRGDACCENRHTPRKTPPS